MTTTYVDLVLDSGELVRIECPSKNEDDLHQSIEDAMKRKDWWSAKRWDNCRATYLGLSLDRVNMARVVGAL